MQQESKSQSCCLQSNWSCKCCIHNKKSSDIQVSKPNARGTVTLAANHSTVENLLHVLLYQLLVLTQDMYDTSVDFWKVSKEMGAKCPNDLKQQKKRSAQN